MGVKITPNQDEMNEMIDLYIETRCNGIVSKLTKNAMANFNKEIANNPNFVRKNGELFNLYKYNKWAGSYKGIPGEGKVLVEERLKNNSVKVAGERFNSDTIDIIQLINDYHKKPEILSKKMTKLFEKERRIKNEFEKNQIKLTKKISDLEEQLRVTHSALLNLIFLTQSPKNSLNNMLSLDKSEDALCLSEIESIFNNNNTYIEKLVRMTSSSNNSSTEKQDNIQQFPTKKTDQEKYSRLRKRG